MDASDLPIERSIRFSPILSLTLLMLACWRTPVTTISLMLCSWPRTDLPFFLLMFVVVSVCWLSEMGCLAVEGFAETHSAMLAPSATQRKVLLNIRLCVLACVRSDMLIQHDKQTVYNY